MSLRKVRKPLSAGEVKILDKLKFINEFMDGAAQAIETIEKEVNQIKKAMVIYNKFTDLLNEKGLVKNEEVKEELRKDGRLQITENSIPTDGEPTNNNVPVEGVVETVPEVKGDGGSV